MRVSHFLLLIAVIFTWGFNFVAVDVALQHLPPLTLCALRFLLVSIPIIFFIKPPAAPFKTVALYGLVMFALQFGLLFGGMSFGIPAGVASIIMQIQVFFGILLAGLFLHEKPTVWQSIGMLVSFVGIAIVGVNLGGNLTIFGFLLLLAAAFCWGLGNVIVKKIAHVNMFSLVIWGNLAALPPMLLFVLLFEDKTIVLSSLQHISWPTCIAVLYIVVFSTFLGYGTWTYLTSQYPIAMIAPYAMLIPVVGMEGSSLILGEPLQLWKLLGGLIVILGLCISFFGPMLLKVRTRPIDMAAVE